MPVAVPGVKQEPSTLEAVVLAFSSGVLRIVLLLARLMKGAKLAVSSPGLMNGRYPINDQSAVQRALRAARILASLETTRMS